MFYTYLIRSKKDKKLYTGATADLRKRFREHNEGKIFSTKDRRPFELVYYEACLREGDAFARERYLKSGLGKRYIKKRLNRFLSQTGFTVIEVIIAVTLMTFLAGIGLWVGMDVYRSYSYRSERNIFISALQKARLEAMVNLNEAKHGLYIETNRYTIFQSTSTYVNRNASFDQIITPAGVITLTGNPVLPRDVVFDQLSGITASGTLTITDGVRSTVISINNEGQISW